MIEFVSAANKNHHSPYTTAFSADDILHIAIALPSNTDPLQQSFVTQDSLTDPATLALVCGVEVRDYHYPKVITLDVRPIENHSIIPYNQYISTLVGGQVPDADNKLSILRRALELTRRKSFQAEPHCIDSLIHFNTQGIIELTHFKDVSNENIVRYFELRLDRILSAALIRDKRIQQPVYERRSVPRRGGVKLNNINGSEIKIFDNQVDANYLGWPHLFAPLTRPYFNDKQNNFQKAKSIVELFNIAQVLDNLNVPINSVNTADIDQVVKLSNNLSHRFKALDIGRMSYKEFAIYAALPLCTNNRSHYIDWMQKNLTSPPSDNQKLPSYLAAFIMAKPIMSAYNLDQENIFPEPHELTTQFSDTTVLDKAIAMLYGNDVEARIMTEVGSLFNIKQ